MNMQEEETKKSSIAKMAVVSLFAIGVSLGVIYGGQRRLIWAGQQKNGNMSVGIDHDKCKIIKLSSDLVYCIINKFI